MLRMGYCGGCNKMSDIKLYNGDCFEIMKYLIAREIQVDAVICDPPYNIFQANWDENF